MKNFISTFFACLLLWAVGAFFLGTFVMHNVFTLLVAVSLITAAAITLYTNQEDRIEALEKKIEELASSDEMLGREI